jgi:DNA-directed RNA polymerase subunit RPC12/RpoP
MRARADVRDSIAMTAAPRPRKAAIATPEIVMLGDAALVRVSGTIDEHFPGFGDLGAASTAVIDVSAVRFMTSFGVARWLRAMAAVPPAVRDVYLAGCPPIFVEQINMILNFAGRAKILSLNVPYTCTKCGAEVDELVDVISGGPQLADGVLPEKKCPHCHGKLAVDVIVTTYLGCLRSFAATRINPAAAQLLQANPAQLQARAVAPAPPRAKPRLDPRLVAAAPVEEPPRRVWLTLLLLLVTVAAIGAGAYLLVGPT